MYDSYNRRIDYLRISVTDKCNLRCRYCMPAEGVPLRRHEDYLSFEQITAVVRAAVKLGVTKVRLTGGEPLVKRGIVDLVKMIRSVEGLQHLAVTTNGTLLSRHAGRLKAAGLDSLNVSLDTLDPDRYGRLTRGGEIRRVLEGIDAAAEAGLPVKINMVVLEDTAQKEIEEMRRFCFAKGLKLQLINHFALGAEKSDNYNFERPPRCDECNKIRLLADGSLKPCLHSDEEIPVDLDDIEGSLRATIARKPERGSMCTGRSMMEIGG
ncbi:MAG: radical SAM protein [Spirochaetaceae bacterium]|nr:MAG: radical SAM protein [Spirochaetaceae bacterium]